MDIYLLFGLLGVDECLSPVGRIAGREGADDGCARRVWDWLAERIVEWLEGMAPFL